MKLIVVGSGSSAHLKVSSQFVSSYHAEILLLDSGEILLTDKGSKNGTFVNGQRLQPDKDVPIKRNDIVRFADQTLDWKDIPSVSMDFSKIIEIRGIGTNYRNKYQIQGEKVSRFHATLKKLNDKNWYIQDHSRNGTTINGQAIRPNVDVKIKKGDTILCAGVPVPNPCGEGSGSSKKVLTILSVILLLCVGGFGIYKLVDGNVKDEKIYEKYKNSTVLLTGYYHYKVTAGGLDLEKELGWDTEVIISDGRLVAVNDLKESNTFYTGTGFYISTDGKIATSLRNVRPWLFSDDISDISNYYKERMARIASTVPEYNAYISQIKVEGVLSYIGVLHTNDKNVNMIQCREISVNNNVNEDVAIIQLETERLPNPDYNIVNLNEAVLDDSKILVGSHIYTMGYPPLTMEDVKLLKKKDTKLSADVQTIANASGSITQECTKYSFGFTAPSYHGTSGSPVFNTKGQLIGVLNVVMNDGQKFNNAIKAVYLKEIFEESNKKK